MATRCISIINPDVTITIITSPCFTEKLISDQFSCVYSDQLFPADEFNLNHKEQHCILKEVGGIRDISVGNTYGPAGSLLLVQRNGRKRQGQRRHMIINLVRGHCSTHNTHVGTSHFSGSNQLTGFTHLQGVYNCSFVDKKNEGVAQYWQVDQDAGRKTIAGCRIWSF